jgi:hypothetical protein
MRTPKQRNVLEQVYDVLVELYTLRAEAKLAGKWEQANVLQQEIERVEAERAQLRRLETEQHGVTKNDDHR